MIKFPAIFLGLFFFGLVGATNIVQGQTTYPEVQSLPFFTTVGDYAESAPSDPGTAILDQFAISMVDFDKQQLTWAWQALNQVLKTNLKSLVSGTVIKKVVDAHGYSAQVGCNNHGQGYSSPEGVGIRLHPHAEEAKFKLTILHELGHIIYNCNGTKSVEWNKAFEAVIAAEGGITRYGDNPACIVGFSDSEFAGRRRSEDFAEMIAYYLLPTASERTIEGACQPTGGPPFANGAYPIHFEFAKSILGSL